MDFKETIELTFSQSMDNIVPLLIITLVFIGVSVISFGILTPVLMAGYYQSILDMIRSGREPAPKDLFSQMRLFLPLLIFSIVMFCIIFIGFMLMVLPGLLLAVAATFYLIYMIPLMTDQNLGVMDAAKESIAMVKQADFVEHLVVVVIFIVVQSLGYSTFVGSLIAIPMTTIFLMNVYDR